MVGTNTEIHINKFPISIDPLDIEEGTGFQICTDKKNLFVQEKDWIQKTCASDTQNRSSVYVDRRKTRNWDFCRKVALEKVSIRFELEEWTDKQLFSGMATLNSVIYNLASEAGAVIGKARDRTLEIVESNLSNLIDIALQGSVKLSYKYLTEHIKKFWQNALTQLPALRKIRDRLVNLGIFENFKERIGNTCRCINAFRNIDLVKLFAVYECMEDLLVWRGWDLEQDFDSHKGWFTKLLYEALGGWFRRQIPEEEKLSQSNLDAVASTACVDLLRRMANQMRTFLFKPVGVQHANPRSTPPAVRTDPDPRSKDPGGGAPSGNSPPQQAWATPF